MSTYNERYDEALSKAPWSAKTLANGKPYLFKYAPHPERTGYLFAATDLESVQFEAMTAPSIPTRLSQIAARDDGQEAADEIDALGYEEQQKRTEGALRLLGEAFDHGWSSATMETETDDYFDAVYVLKSGDFSWIFNMTEMRSRQPLSFIAKQLMSPVMLLLAQDRGVDMPHSKRPIDGISAVVSDAGVARALRRVVGAPPPASARHTPAPKPSASASPAPRKSASPTPKPKPKAKRPKTPSPEQTPLARPPTPPRASASQTLPPLLPPSSPTPARGKVYDYAAGILPSSTPASPRGSSSSALERSTSPTRPPKKVSPPTSTPPKPKRLAEDIPSSDMPASTDPLIPTQKKKKKKPKKDEDEEDAEAEKRRAEMKRRMASGGRGGGLGRRRI